MKSILHKALKVKEAAWARICLRRCTAVGILTRVTGRIMIANAGVIKLGQRVRINGRQVPVELATGPRGEVLIGDGTGINCGTSICAHRSVRIGKNCGIGNYSLIMDTDFHEIGDHTQTRLPEPAAIVIGDRVWIAARSIIMKGVTIGEGAVVSAGSVVVTNVAPYTLVGGVPARFIRKLTPAEGAPETDPLTQPPQAQIEQVVPA